MRLLGLSVAVVSLVVPSADRPGPLRGLPLREATAVSLVVAGTPPFLLDVDDGRVAPLTGVPLTRGLVGVVGVGGRAAVVRADGRLYGVRGRRVVPLGRGERAVAAGGGTAVWIQSGTRRCTLRRVAVDGRLLRRPHAFPCATASDPPGGALGLVVKRTRVVDPVTGRTVLRTRRGIAAVAGRSLLLRGRGRNLILRGGTGAERRLGWPSALGGMNAPAVDPTGRYVALRFADPAWGSEQAIDVWLLDTETAELTQLPAMPAFVSLKFTAMDWTADGRLVLLAQRRGRDVVAIWRPGRARLALKPVRLPERHGASIAAMS